MPGPDVVRCNQYKTGVVGDTRISKKYLIKYGCFGNQYDVEKYHTSTILLPPIFQRVFHHSHHVFP